MIALKHGAGPDEFERFWREEFEPGYQIPGITWRLPKGVRGDRAGRYLVMGEIESVEVRDRYFPVADPAAGQVSPEVGQFFGARAAAFPKWEKLATAPDVIFTDYVDVS
jgi:hypothetical protein